jgi:peptidoglycan hydrolase-like protein with peptidoglycan-binding domain
LDTRRAIDVYFSGSDLQVADVESDDSRQKRHQRADEERRLAELDTARKELDALGNSDSEVVRIKSKELIHHLLSLKSPSPADVEAVQRQKNILVQFARAEAERLDALRKLTQIKEVLEKRISAISSGDFRDELTRLNAEYSSISSSTIPFPEAKVAPQQQNPPVGPSFNCAGSRPPLQRIICADYGLRRLDIEYLQPFYVLSQAVPGSRAQLKDEGEDVSRRVDEKCHLSERRAFAQNTIKRTIACVAAEYRQKRDIWRARVDQQVSISGREEARRSVADHVHLHLLLRQIGVLRADDRADGVYRKATRDSIAAFQRTEGLPSDGIMSDATAERVLRRTSIKEPNVTAVIDTSTTQRLVELGRRYDLLLAQIKNADAAKTHDEELKTRIQDAIAFAKRALTYNLPHDLNDRVTQLISTLEGMAQAANDEPAIVRAIGALDALRPPIEDWIAVKQATTAKNRFLVEGDASDTLILFNDTGKAPSVIKNLHGDVIFDKPTVAACQPHSDGFDKLVVREVNARLSKWSVALRFPLSRCNAQALINTDLIVFSRGALLKEKKGDVVALLFAVDSGVFGSMLAVTADEVKKAWAQEQQKLLEIEAGIEKGTKPGFGVVLLTNKGKALCEIVQDDREPHEFLLRRQAARLEEEIGGGLTFFATSSDAAFIGIKRGQCGAVYGNTQDLKELVLGLRRDQITFRFLPIWVELADVTSAKAEIAKRKEDEKKAQADRDKQKEDDNGRIGMDRSKKQEQLRKQYGTMARAFETLLVDEMKDYLEDRSQRAGTNYPQIKAWYETRRRNQWELVSISTTLDDYGNVEFKGRSLEAGFVKTLVKMRNRNLGEYSEQCFYTGFILDREFDIERAPVSADCGKPEQLRDYYHAHGFTSRWIVQ